MGVIMEDNKPASGSGQDDSSAESGDSQNNATPPEAEDKVSYETYRKTVDEVKKLKARHREALEKLDSIESAKADAEKQKLKDKEQWQDYAKRIETELTEKLNAATSKLSEYQERDVYVKKVTAFRKALDGDLDPRFYTFIPVDQIEFLPDSDQVDEMTVTKAVEAFRKENGDLIKKPGGPGLPNNAPGSGSKGIDYESWLKLPAKEMREKLKEVRAAEDKT